ncbi:MAG TPA: hypothetical protein VMB34_14595 [Acetobacteraceae bacterium]|nr:hypothetical protein [Acetobacteraceae bacterium]
MAALEQAADHFVDVAVVEADGGKPDRARRWLRQWLGVLSCGMPVMAWRRRLTQSMAGRSCRTLNKLAGD